MPFANEVITLAALETLLWVSTIPTEPDEDGDTSDEPADSAFGVFDFPAADTAVMAGYVTGFLDCISSDSTAYLLEHVTAEQIGHDLVLTAQHHGAGFWDRGYPQAIADDLTKWAQTFSIEFEVGDDALPHVR